MNHMMIDLETLDTCSSAVVVSVGAVVFSEKEILRTGYWVLDQKDQLKNGRTMNPDTVSWWMRQSDQARSVFIADKTELGLFNNQFIDLFKDEKLQLWGNGADFDLSIMIDLWRTQNLYKTSYWSYSNHRCFRTFNWMTDCKKLVSRVGTHHNALDDAIFQTECVLEHWKRTAILKLSEI